MSVHLLDRREAAAPQLSACRPAVIAHRGLPHPGATENSLRGVLGALRSGSDAVELDVRASADDALVLMHDGTPLRTTHGDAVARQRRIERSTVGQLQRLRLRDAAGHDTDEPVPLLGEVLDLVHSWDRTALLDIKVPWRRHRRVWALLTDYLHRLSAQGRSRVLVQSTDLVGIAALSAAVPQIRVAAVSWSRWRPRAEAPIYAVSSASWALSPATMNCSFIQGQRVLAWVVNDRVRLERVVRLGVDAVITDRPADVLATLDHRAASWAVLAPPNPDAPEAPLMVPSSSAV